MNRTNRIELAALVALILLAAALRVYRLEALDFWGDEAFSISLSQQPLTTVVAGAADTHPPLYPLLLFFWLKLVGASPFGARALSVLIAIPAVPLIFVFAKRLTARSRSDAHASFTGSAPWFAALLAAISPLLIYYSQETRMYELVAVLALASTYFAARLISGEADNRARLWGAYLLSTALAMYTHYSAFFVIATQDVYALIRLIKDRRALLRWVLMQLVLAVAYVPWILVQTSFLSGKASARLSDWSWSGIEMIFGKTFLSFSMGLTADFPIIQIATLVFLSFAALGAIVSARTERRLALLAPLYFLAPVVVAFLVDPIMPFFYERYVLVALPGFIVTVALGLDYIARRSPRAAIGMVGILVIAGAYSLYNYYYNDAYAKGKYGQMMAYVSSHVQPGDALILNNPLQKPLYNYYAPRDLPAFFFPDGPPLEDPQTRHQFETVANSHPRLWLVMFGNPAEYDPTGYLERWLGAHAFESFSRGFVDASLSLYDMPGPATTLHPVGVTLGENIRLVSYELNRAQQTPGSTLQLTLHWQATSPIAAPYKVFTHLIGTQNPATQSPLWAQMDGEPVGGSRPTGTWQVGETIDDRYGLQLPPNSPPGAYAIEVGMYDPATSVRLPVFDEKGNRVPDDRVLLDSVKVVAQ